jgi:hypothetical protein
MKQRAAWVFSVTLASLVMSCGSGGGGSGLAGAAGKMDLVAVSNGFGTLVPHQAFRPDAQGNPTAEVVAIRSVTDLIANVLPSNPILPSTEWPTSAALPNGDPGNHFICAQFTQPLDIERVLDATPSGQANSGLTGTISVLALDPATGTAVPVQGRAFIGGVTFAGSDPEIPGRLAQQRWVRAGPGGNPVAAKVAGAFPGRGFPGTESVLAFEGARSLTDPSTFVFVADTDGDLSTHETFPAGRQIKLRASLAVTSKAGRNLVQQVLASCTVGSDSTAPEVATTPPPNSFPLTTPAFNDKDVDPMTHILIEFTEPLQPWTVGPLPTGTTPTLSSAISITFGPNQKVVNVPFEVLPPSVYDLSVWELIPAFGFPGEGPELFQCGVFNRITLAVNAGQLQDLRQNPNSQAAETFFETGEGPGLVNAPVTPDAIYVGRLGATPGVSVIDLNGFGQGTGNPTFDYTYTSFPEGSSNFPNNPNLGIQGSVLRPPLLPPVCTVDGGSAGVFTLTCDSALQDLLLRAPVVTSIGDMALGHPLDLVFNNGQEPSGCQAGGGNLCAARGRKVIQVAFANTSPNAGSAPGNLPNAPAVGLSNMVPGGGNVVSWGPHPNPPPLIFPPLCVSPFIGGQEPTSFEVIQPPPPVTPNGQSLSNLLTPGDPFGQPNANPPIPPSGTLTRSQNCYFEGPSPVRPVEQCQDYMIRQQVGQFLYVTDRARREIVVLNSNRFTVLGRIPVSDPTDLAMGPNLDLLAVSNQKASTVSFIDINPASATFHQVVKTTDVGAGPRGISWDPGNEDIIVCNELEGSISIISAASLEVRKQVSSHLTQPFDVAIQQRQFNFGFFRNVYFAFIMNRNGDLALFESGPNGVNGWGYDDVIGVAPFTFQNPKRIAIDFSNPNGSVWVLHENQLLPNGNQSGLQGGAVTNVFIDSAITGQLPLNVNSLLIPQFRDMALGIKDSVGPDRLTGIPVDIALDDMVNHGGLENMHAVQAAGTPALLNGKSIMRRLFQGVPGPAKFPTHMFLAVPNSSEGPGVVDVVALTPGFPRVDTNAHRPGVQSVPAAGATFLMDYWRQ